MARERKFKNPWAKGGEYYPDYLEEGDTLEGNAVSLVALPTFSNEMKGLADAAEALAGISLIMDYYYNFQEGHSGFFFSPNPNLKSATKRPSKFNSWNDWNALAPNQKRTISLLGGFKEDATNIKKNDTDLEKLKKAYDKWLVELYSVFWQNESFRGVWTCNIFVGDAIYLWKKKSITNENKHYYGPADVKAGKGPFKKLTTDKVKRGAIVVFGSTHTEIITETKTYWIADDGFCSIGAGRNSRSGTGEIRCDTSTTLSGSREIENSDNSYYTL
jgi:hypothetical protein